MPAFVLPVLVLWPIIGGAVEPLLPFRKRGHRCVYIEAVVLINSVLALCTMANRSDASFTVFYFTRNLSLSFRLDELGMVFVGIISLLWPLATLFAFEYMKKEEHEKVFFMFYTITFGVTMGIALAEDIVTMYCFYEILTLVTLPLVMHTLTREAMLASRTYLYYMIGGAAFAFIGMVFLLMYGTTSNFVPGGVLDAAALGDKVNLALLIYVICFCGFSVKAAMWPFCGWLPKAGVAPTPVTALLHAVAVVKAGAFAVMRITYYSFGTDFLRGSWAQKVVMVPVIITIVYGCSRALKETHFKRRLAWSTVSNLSYILFGVVLMTPAGLIGALCHMVFHAVMKICLFFCAGAAIYKSGRQYIFQLDGIGKRMPKTFVIFTIAGLALMGVPGLCGFVSKWKLADAAIGLGTPLAIAGVMAMLISALLTAIYTMTISVRAFLPVEAEAGQTTLPEAEILEEKATALDANTKQTPHNKEEKSDQEGIVPMEQVTDPNWMMLLPLVLFIIAILVFGLHSQSLIHFFELIAAQM